MTKTEIVEKMAKSRMVEGLIDNIAKEREDALKDLAQDIYVSLLMKDEEKIQQLWENEQMNFFVTRMIINNIRSKNSRYYYLYKKFLADTTTIDDLNI